MLLSLEIQIREVTLKYFSLFNQIFFTIASAVEEK